MNNNNMVKKIYFKVFALLAALLIIMSGMIIYKGKTQRNDNSGDSIIITTSFYPIYTIGLNIVDGVRGTNLSNLTPNVTGCLHDFQLSPDQVLLLQRTDAIIINGAGAESFLEDIISRQPGLNIVDSSAGIDILPLEGHDHEHSEEDEPPELHFNEHIWMDVAKYIVQIKNITTGICNIDPENSEIYKRNSDVYIDKVNKIKDEMDTLKREVPVDAILFHNSISYFADYLNLNVIGEISIGEENVSAHELKEVADKASYSEKTLLLYDGQYSIMYQNLASDHGTVVVLDAAVSQKRGAVDKDSWLLAMRDNINKIKSFT